MLTNTVRKALNFIFECLEARDWSKNSFFCVLILLKDRNIFTIFLRLDDKKYLEYFNLQQEGSTIDKRILESENLSL